jgi:uncharacterized membrane protein
LTAIGSGITLVNMNASPDQAESGASVARGDQPLPDGATKSQARRRNSLLQGLGSPGAAEFRESWKRDANSDYELPVDTWSTSRERDQYLERRRYLAIPWALALVLLVVGWLLIRPPKFSEIQWAGYGSLALAVLLLLCSLIPYLSSRTAYRERRRATAAARVDRALMQLSPSDPAKADSIDFAKLYQLNRRQLDQYQELTKKQQRSSFYLTQAATITAFLALLAGIGVALSVESQAEKFLGAGLSALGALLSTFLAKTFYKAHQAATQLLDTYYEEPQRTGTFLAAERLARSLDAEPASQFAKTLVSAVLRAQAPRYSQPPKRDSTTGEELAGTNGAAQGHSAGRERKNSGAA